MGKHGDAPLEATRFQLVDTKVSGDTVEVLEWLLAQAKSLDPNKQLVGIAFVAIYHHREYIVDALGEAKNNPTFSRGAIKALDDKLALLVGSRELR